MNSFYLRRFLASALALAVTACGSNSSPTGDGGAPGADAGQDAAMAESDSGADTCRNGVCDPGETVESCFDDCYVDTSCQDRVACSACGTRDECAICCEEAESAAYDELVNGIVQACGCTSGSVCDSVCADNVCTGTDPSPDCVDCINGAIGDVDPCLESSLASCQASDTCSPFIACNQGCPG